MIGIVNYGIGNIGSVANVLDASEIPFRILERKSDFLSVTRLILPGVGAFDAAMEKLRNSGSLDALEDAVLVRRIPVLGLCLGMQMMFSGSEEGTRPGLGWLPGHVISFDRTKLGGRLPIPHMSWATVREIRPTPLASALKPPARFYFAHSFHVQTDSPDVVIAESTYGYSFPAVVGQHNILGVQFHPEKSRQFGARLLRTFALEAFP